MINICCSTLLVRVQFRRQLPLYSTAFLLVTWAGCQYLRTDWSQASVSGLCMPASPRWQAPSKTQRNKYVCVCECVNSLLRVMTKLPR